MGWCFHSVFNSPKTYEDEKREVARIYSNEGKNEILQMSKVSSVWYLAVKTLATGEVWAGVCLTKSSKGEWGYKAMSEDVIPYYFDAPKTLLDKLTETTYDSSIKWRKTCREVIESKANAKKQMKIVEPGTVFDVTGLFGKVNGVELKTMKLKDMAMRSFFCPEVGITYRLKKKQVEEVLKKNMA